MPSYSARPALADLRRRIEMLESKETPGGRSARFCALGPLKMTLGALHEIRPHDWRDAPAAYGLALAMAGKVAAVARKPTVWISTARAISSVGRTYGCALHSFGVNSAKFIAVFSRNAQETLWAAEEASGTASVGAVLIEFLEPHRLLDLTATRRLQLAAESSQTFPILLRSGDDAEPSAARTRWRVAAAPSAIDAYDVKSSGNSRWRVELEKCRNGGRGMWMLEWDNERGELREATIYRRAVPEMVDGSPEKTAAIV